MDITIKSVLQLWEQGCSRKEIERRVNISHNKVVQILVTYGYIKTAESELAAQGKSVEEICDILQKSRQSVLCRLPYQKGMYNAEYPSKNALKIRKTRRKSDG